MSKTTCRTLLALAVSAVIAAMVLGRPARGGEYGCDLVRQGVEQVGRDPAALEQLAVSYGIVVTHTMRRKALDCLRAMRWSRAAGGYRRK